MFTQYEIILKNHLALHRPQCIDYLQKFILLFKKEQQQCSENLICICETHDNYAMALSFLSEPSYSNYGQILSEVEDGFFSTPRFFDFDYQKNMQSLIAQYIERNQLDFDEYEIAGTIYMKSIEKWLSDCWVTANRMSQTSYPCYFFYHRYFAHPWLDLLSGDRSAPRWN